MAIIERCAVGLGLVLVAAGADGIALREGTSREGATRVVVEVQAKGSLHPRGAKEGETAPPIALEVATRFEFIERVSAVGPMGGASRVVRRSVGASVAAGGQIRPLETALRREVATLVVERRDGSVFAYSPGGPLTRPELELVEGPGDPLMFPDLLPPGPVAEGDTWSPGQAAARSLSGYDAVTTSSLKARLEALDDDRARVRLAGEVRGSVLGGEGTMTLDGSYSFDRRVGRLDRLVLSRSEKRKPGPVEAGLDVQGTLTVTRTPADVPPELSDPALSALPTESPDALDLLLYEPPGGRYALLHDRGWHIYWDDQRLAVLRRIEGSSVVAQCNLAKGPDAGPGRHQDPSQFLNDIRAALGTRFGDVLGQGEVDDDGEGFRYKVAVQGRQGDLDVVWYYYLIASPGGEQVLATFTLAAAAVERFGDRDLRMVGSLQWRERTARTGPGK